MKSYLSSTRPPFSAFVMGFAILWFSFAPTTQASLSLLRQGEGTGHQRVAQLVGRTIAPQKVFYNERFNPSYIKLAAVNMDDVSVIILQNDDVINKTQIQKMNFIRSDHNFNNLHSVIHRDETIEKDEIWAVIVK